MLYCELGIVILSKEKRSVRKYEPDGSKTYLALKWPRRCSWPSHWLRGQTVLASQHSDDSDCHFALGFKELRDLIPDVVGDCVENEQHDSSAGVTTQRTSRGVMTWNKSDNLTTFTDDSHTWIIGLDGLLQRDETPHTGLLDVVEETLAAPEAFGGLRASPLAVPAGGSPLWAVHSNGSRFGLLDAEEPSHFVAIYTREGTEWRELARLGPGERGIRHSGG